MTLLISGTHAKATCLWRINNKSSPKSFGRACHYPHIAECTLPLCVLAVACAMCNKALQSIVGRYRTLQKRYRVLWSITEHYGVLRDVTGRYGKYQFCPSLTNTHLLFFLGNGPEMVHSLTLMTTRFKEPCCSNSMSCK